jgi:hypothetical protein
MQPNRVQLTVLALPWLSVPTVWTILTMKVEQLFTGQQLVRNLKLLELCWQHKVHDWRLVVENLWTIRFLKIYIR